MEKLRTFLKDESGQDLVEYAMLLALIVLAALAGVGGFGGNAGTVWSHIATTTAGYMGS
ncbi:MAG: Flp family type IVb pilin [Bryobacterales bacterium]|nr:Flp family type IVb pilin [Bryobacterales bacterium]